MTAHRRNIPVPIHIQHAGGADLTTANPIALQRAVSATAEEVPTKHQFTRNGTLIVHVWSEEVAARLLEASDLKGMDIKAHIPGTYLVNSAMFKDAPFYYTVDQLFDMLRDQDVVRARRRFRRRHHGPNGLERSGDVIVGLKLGSDRPKILDLGWTKHKVHDFIEGPRRCFNCQRHGHIARHYRSDTRCLRCGGPHAYTPEVCPKIRIMECANCNGPHPANFTGCRASLGHWKELGFYSLLPQPTMNSPRQTPSASSTPQRLDYLTRKETWAPWMAWPTWTPVHKLFPGTSHGQQGP